jgi:Maltokinase N-terminal cap domain
MAIVHRAELTPSKLDLLAAWLPGCPWFVAQDPIERISAFRFDDPAGEVGLETFIVGSGTARFHVPLTYRATPLDGGVLVGRLQHSVLGPRWVYDGPSDPVYVAAIHDAIVHGARDVDMVLDDGTPVPRLDWWATATGSGATAEQAAGLLQVARGLPADVPADAPRLSASWPGQEAPTAVAWLSG